MPRTRDFAIIFTAVFFLIVAIFVTTLYQFLNSPVRNSNELRPSSSLIEEYTVETFHSETSREASIEALKKKVALQDSVIKMPEEQSSDDEEEILADVAQEESSDDVLLCSQFNQIVSVAWTPQDTFWQQVEGARILYERPYEEIKSIATTSSSSLPAKDIVRMQLPLVTVPVSNPSCIPTDVIGIALDGSLIRNDEVSLYSVFGAETIIGYALDGFPINGTSAERSDKCGGRTVSGQYRYELSRERTSVINCFVGTPQALN